MSCLIFVFFAHFFVTIAFWNISSGTLLKQTAPESNSEVQLPEMLPPDNVRGNTASTSAAESTIVSPSLTPKGGYLPAPLVIVPFHGLGNKIYALVDAYLLAKALKRPLAILWDGDSHCGASIWDVLDLSYWNDATIIAPPLELASFNSSNWYMSSIPLLPPTCCKSFTLAYAVNYYPSGHSLPPKGLDASKNEVNLDWIEYSFHKHNMSKFFSAPPQKALYIAAFYSFFRDLHDDERAAAFRLLKPSRAVQGLLSSISWPQVSPVGIHIHLSDQANGVYRETLNISHLVSSITANTSLTQIFFVSSDESWIISDLEMALPNRILFLNSTRPPPVPFGYQPFSVTRGRDVVITGAADLFLLSRCSSIRSNRLSSFSSLAANIAGISLSLDVDLVSSS